MMDPKKQTKEMALAILGSVKMFGEVINADPKKIEDVEFMDSYEELWA